MELCPSWTSWSHLWMMAASRLQCIGNPPTLTYIYSGIATTPFHQSTVWQGHCITEQRPSAQTKRCCWKKNNTFSRDWKKCKYPTWALNRVKMRCQNPSNKRRNNNNSQQNNHQEELIYGGSILLGLSESIKRSCKKYGVQVHFKGGLAIKNLLMAPKDKDHPEKKWSHVQT